MKINFDAPILDLKGKPMMEKQAAENSVNGNQPRFIDVPVTLGSISAFALLAQKQGEKDVSGKEKASRFKLALRVSEGEHDLKAEEVVLLKDRIAEVYSPLYVGRAWEILDPESTTEQD